MPLLSPGEKLGPYEIQEQLGAGGMGEVWKARDPRLNRFVAIKKSQGQFSERFAREAQAIAALNHPHICQIYDVGPDYLVMEYVEGKPLTGPLPVAQALEYAEQICDALDAAHRKGITHRDLKPGNILVGKTGVKILDFGLAKMESASAKPDDATVTMALTAVGMMVGTPQYMAPEQFEGREADARSDIYAFGLVLYEMLSGKRPFSGATQASLIASILKDQPPSLREMEPLVSAPLERVVRTCLEKDPDKRWQSAREVKHALEWIQDVGQGHALPDSQGTALPHKKSRLWPAISAALAVALGVTALVLWPKPPPLARVVRFQIKLPADVPFREFVSLSPDGHKLVFNATGDQSGLWIHDLETLEWRRLEGTEGGQSPFWSPDSRFLGFAVGNQLKKMDVAGGPPQTLCSVEGVVGTGTWNRDGVIVFGMRTGALHWVSAAGGVPADVTVLDNSRGETFHSLPTFLPDGKHFLYLRQGLPGIRGIYAGSLDAKPAEQSRERILDTGFAAPYLDGNLFFMRDGTLMAQLFDDAKLQLRGEPVPVAEHVGVTGSTGIFSVATGVLAYRAGAAAAANFQATWFDRQGKVLGTFGERGPDRGFTLSPDGMNAAVRNAVSTQPGDIWRLDFARGVRTRLTFRQSAGSTPTWSPDGGRIVFAAGDTFDTLYEKASSGAGEEKELFKKPGEIKFPSSWSHDGRFLLYETELTPKTGTDLWVLPLEGDRKPVLLLGTEFGEGLGTFSPDMRWIAYVSTETGRAEVYVRPFIASGPSLGEGKWQVSKDGGTGTSRWRADGKELIFSALNGSPMAVDVSANGAAFQPGVPKQLFAAPAGLAGGWDVTSDGKRFLMGIAPVQQTVDEPITVVLNWQAALKK
ncbi:MAG TPA: protein kinase [Bryobacteraceae bacterium]|nr:protein kinase [Bryobacteraceae bacterium]